MGSNPAGGMNVHLVECRVLSDGGLCDELITRPEESQEREDHIPRWASAHRKQRKELR